MNDTTIVTDSPVGKHLDAIGESKPASYLMFNNKKINLVAKITIGRDGHTKQKKNLKKISIINVML